MALTACPGMTDEGQSSQYGVVLLSHCWSDSTIATPNGMQRTICMEETDPNDPLGLCKLHVGSILKPKVKRVRRWLQPDDIFYEDDA